MRNTWLEQIAAEYRVKAHCLVIALPYLPMKKAHKAANEAKEELAERFTNDRESNKELEIWIVDRFQQYIEETYASCINTDNTINWQ